ncbi:MAG: PfkB family carbohydrate kinase [Gaiellales bacterium]
MRLAVIGHVEWVTFAHAPFVPTAGQIVHLDDLLDQAGGGGAVTAIALARMGADVTFYTALGADVPAQSALESLGVRVYAAHRDHNQTRVLALVDPAGERTLYVIGENDHPTADDPLPWDELAEADGVYFTGQDPRTLRLARRAPVLVVTARRFRSLVESGVRADALVGSSTDPGEQFDIEELAERPAHVIVTKGRRGGSGYAAAPVPGPVVDTYGAGDTFVAGITFGLASGWDLDRSLKFAAERAAEVLTWRGVYPPAPVDSRPSE